MVNFQVRSSQSRAKGKVVYFESFGSRDAASSQPMSKDAIFRIYSMTKPLVSVAAMMLVEDGTVQLTDPIAKFLPAFAKMQVSVASKNDAGNVYYDIVPAVKPITVQDLLRHTAGLTYGELTTNPAVKEAYGKASLYKPGAQEYEARDLTPAEEIDRLAAIPLIHQPGTTWNTAWPPMCWAASSRRFPGSAWTTFCKRGYSVHCRWRTPILRSIRQTIAVG